MTVEVAKHRELGLTDSEFERIRELLGRDPNEVELAMFSLLWSEHCAYKHSRKLLTQAAHRGAARGDGSRRECQRRRRRWRACDRVQGRVAQSPECRRAVPGRGHRGRRHPPRSVFALGARPIAVLDSLRFGELGSERSRYLFEHVVRGLGHYGNSIGVPTVGGEIYFEAPYEHNRLVNAMCVGLAARRRWCGRPPPEPERDRPDGRLDRARRHRRGLGPCLGRARRG